MATPVNDHRPHPTDPTGAAWVGSIIRGVGAGAVGTRAMDARLYGAIGTMAASRLCRWESSEGL